MPAFDEDQFKELLERGGIGAISLDTSIFGQYRYDLSSRTLMGLRQFRHSPTNFVLSQVVLEEVRKNRTEEANASRSKLDTALKQASKHWGLQLQPGLTDGWPDAAIETERLVAEFAGNTQFDLVDPDNFVDQGTLLHRYFNSMPPFSVSGTKKSEFPDAIALMSLEAWARQNQTSMLVVSKDDDWASFAEHSDQLFCVPDLAVALAYFNEDGKFIAERVARMLASPGNLDLKARVREALIRYLGTIQPQVRVETRWRYEIESTEVSLIDWNMLEDIPPQVLDVDEVGVLFSFSVMASIQCTVTLNFTMRDSLDGDEVDLGSTEESVVEEHILDIEAWVEKGEQPNIDITDIPGTRISFDFGDASPI